MNGTAGGDDNEQELRIGGYKLGSTLGVGTFGKVKRATHLLTGVNVAVKILNRGKVKELKMDSKIKREIHILQLFHHPHIIRMYEVIETPTDVFMFMEFVSGGELFDLIVQKGKLDEPEARRFFQQIISGVQYCHHHRVVHRDLKPENLLLDGNGNVKIADFGLSNIMEDGAFLQTSCGSPNYAAPEVISGLMYSGQEIDVWSCGVILYALVVGKLPFDEDYIPTLFQKIRNGVYQMPAFLSAPCCDLIRRLLDINPITRITVLEVKSHEWFVVGLPAYLREDSAHLSKAYVGIKDLDRSIVDIIVARSGVPEREVVQKLQSDTNNDFLVAYNLLLDSNPQKGIHVSASGNTLLGGFDGGDGGGGGGSGSDGGYNMATPERGNSSSGGGGRNGRRGSQADATGARSFATSPPMNLREDASLIPVPGLTSATGLLRQAAASPTSGAGAQFKLSPGPFGAGNGAADDGDDFGDAMQVDDELLVSTAGFAGKTPNTSGGNGNGNGTALTPGTHQLSKTWYLGLMTEKSPDAIMLECYRVLRLCDYEWKAVTKFHVRVRPVLRKQRAMSMQKKRKSAFGTRDRDPGGRELVVPTNDNVKFDLQLYRVGATQCLLDFKRLSDEGTTLGFLITAQTIIACLNI